MNSKDPVMISIEEYKETQDTDCKEGYITSDGVVKTIGIFKSFYFSYLSIVYHSSTKNCTSNIL